MLKIWSSLLVILVILLFQHNLSAQEVGFYGFYQSDLLYSNRPGISFSFIKKINKLFSIETEYGNQYINQSYTISSFEYNSKINAKIFMNNLSLSPIIKIVNKDNFTFQIGSKHTIFLIVGKENVNHTYYNYLNDTTFILVEKDYTRNPLKPYYSYSNEFIFQYRKVFIPQVSVVLKISAGYILNGSRLSGCVVMPSDIFAPYGRISFGMSYNFKR